MLFTSLFLACAGDISVDTASAPTWHGDVAPLLGERCVGCHVEGGMRAELPLDSYDRAAPIAGLIADAAEGALSVAQMPPFLADETETCQPEHPWMHDPRLNDDEIALLRDWAEAGAPEGDPDSAAPIPDPPAYSLEGAEAPIYAAAFTTAPIDEEVQDEFICFILDPLEGAGGWLEGVEVMPGELKVAHHATIYTAEDTDELEAARTAAPRYGDDWYECFGGSGVAGDFIGAWIPGAPPLEVPGDSAVEIPEGAKIVVQMHYHLDEGQTDQTGLAFRWADEAPTQPAYLELRGNAENANQGLQPGPNDDGDPEFLIPAGAASHTETIRYTLAGDNDFLVWVIASHMHYIGVDMSVHVERAAPREGEDAEACLLQTPDWDFDWQQFYFYDAASGAAPRVSGGDTLVLTCTYDNTLDNPGVQKALQEYGYTEPVDISLGEGSLNEMCVALIGVIPE